MTRFTVTLVNPAAAGAQAGAVTRCLQAAADAWAPYIQSAATLDIALTIGDVGEAIATGGTGYRARGGGPFVANTVSEVLTGTDPNGAEADISVTLSPDWLDRLSYAVSGPVPADRVDGFSVFEHELGHGLGLMFVDGSTYSSFVRTSGGQSVFTGPNARLSAGGDLPLDSDRSHLASGDLMDPTAEYGRRPGISDDDLAILQDIGMPIATQRSDTVTLSAAANVFLAYAGDDTVLAGAGGDLVFGNQGSDRLAGEAGADTLFGGQDRDTVDGGDGGDLLFGNLGADLVLGGAGDDTLFGGQGGDSLYGGDGSDVLMGDLGDDLLDGGAGADRFVFGAGSGRDVVAGFSADEGDRLSFSGQSYVLGSAADGNALLALSGGGTVELLGLTQAQVEAGFVA